MSGIAPQIMAAAATGAWLALTGATVWRHRVRPEADVEPDAVLIAYASQTGTAAALAKASAEALAVSGRKVVTRSFANLTPAMLGEASDALFIAATTGEGDAPDDAAAFLRRLSDKPLALGNLRYALLALGDTHYRNFCAFGRSLDRLLSDAGAVHAADRVEVDQGDAGAIRHWQQNLRLFGASTSLPDWEAPRYAGWTLAERELLNPGSPGGAMYRLRLEPQGDLPRWSAGDIAEVYPGPVEEALGSAPELAHRDYSLATVPEEGGIGLVVRLFKDDSGQAGLGSGWLCDRAAIGESVALRIRENARFHTPAAEVPMIVIGNGTGISALRAHLKARQNGSRNWLLYGERDPKFDRPFGGELQGWLATGHLACLTHAFSRTEGVRQYVQDAVTTEIAQLREWVDEGAAILVCGSVAMGEAVDGALRSGLGEDRIEILQASNRYRRDIY